MSIPASSGGHIGNNDRPKLVQQQQQSIPANFPWQPSQPLLPNLGLNQWQQGAVPLANTAPPQQNDTVFPPLLSPSSGQWRPAFPLATTNRQLDIFPLASSLSTPSSPRNHSNNKPLWKQRSNQPSSLSSSVPAPGNQILHNNNNNNNNSRHNNSRKRNYAETITLRLESLLNVPDVRTANREDPNWKSSVVDNMRQLRQYGEDPKTPVLQRARDILESLEDDVDSASTTIKDKSMHETAEERQQTETSTKDCTTTSQLQLTESSQLGSAGVEQSSKREESSEVVALANGDCDDDSGPAADGGESFSDAESEEQTSAFESNAAVEVEEATKRPMVSESSSQKDVTSAAMPGNGTFNSTGGPIRQDAESEKEQQGTYESTAAVEVNSDATKASSEVSESATEMAGVSESSEKDVAFTADGTSNQTGGPTNSQKALEALRAKLKKAKLLKEVAAKKKNLEMARLESARVLAPINALLKGGLDSLNITSIGSSGPADKVHFAKTNLIYDSDDDGSVSSNDGGMEPLDSIDDQRHSKLDGMHHACSPNLQESMSLLERRMELQQRLVDAKEKMQRLVGRGGKRRLYRGREIRRRGAGWNGG